MTSPSTAGSRCYADNHLHPQLLETRVLDSMTDRYLADPLLSSKGRTGGGLRITLASIRTYQSTTQIHITFAHVHTALTHCFAFFGST